MKHDEALHLAILTVGSRRKLGRLLGLSGQAVAGWRRIPAERVLDTERVTGISRVVLRPDLYGPGTEPPASLDLTSLGLEDVSRRTAARVVYSLLASDPDLLGQRDAVSVSRRMANIIHEELFRAISKSDRKA